MTIAKIIVGTITGIPRALALGASDSDDFYAVADALQKARNAVLSEALRRVTVEDGRRLAVTEAQKLAGHTEHTPVARSGAAPSPSGNGGFSA